VAGIYIHIPFCKKACSYCDFHFSTSIKNKKAIVNSLLNELELRKDYINEPVESIYFGGGTPSLLEPKEIQLILEKVYSLFQVNKDSEVTLEGNPDDLTLEYLKAVKSIGINRLSVGVQSFIEDDLQLMNRAHNKDEALIVIRNIKKAGFDNYTIDLLYGTPGQTKENWIQNLNILKEFDIPHFSGYALTVEEKTLLHHQIKTGEITPLSDEKTTAHFKYLIDFAQENDYNHYELSSFCKEGFQAKHNFSYWDEKNYLGIGPSAHSYNGTSRQWNVANNNVYIKEIQKNIVPSTIEHLTNDEKFNETLLIKLRLSAGLPKKDLNQFEEHHRTHFYLEIDKWMEKNLVKRTATHYKLTQAGKMYADQITSDLFYLD
jgi:oxygen-independent coproporphyrinogen-3 oxidase